MNYNYRSEILQAVIHAGFQNYLVDTISKDDSAFSDADPYTQLGKGKFFDIHFRKDLPGSRQEYIK